MERNKQDYANIKTNKATFNQKTNQEKKRLGQNLQRKKTVFVFMVFKSI